MFLWQWFSEEPWLFSSSGKKPAEDVNNLQDYAKAKLQSFSWKKMYEACPFNNDQSEFL